MKDTKIEMEPTPGKVEARQEGAKHIPEQNQVNKAIEMVYYNFY